MFGLNGNHRTENLRPAPRLLYLRLVSFILVWVILLTMGWGIAEVVRGLENELTWIMTMVAVAVGWVLVKYTWKKWTAVLFTFASGVFFTSMMVGRLWDDGQRMMENLAFWTVQTFDAFWRTIHGQLTFPSWESLFLYIYDFTENMFIMFQRMVLWIWRFPRMNTDLIATMLIWGLLIWLASVWAAWFLWQRRKPLEAVIPAFLLVAIARTYADASSNVLLVMLGATVALMILSAQADRESNWSKRGVGYSELIRKNSAQAALMLSTVLVFAAGGITSIDIDELRERWEDFTTKHEPAPNGEGVSSSLGIEKNPDRATLAESFSRLSRGGLPTNHLVGSGPELSEEVVMLVRVEETDPVTGDVKDIDFANQTYYLRSLTFDQYTSQGWLSNGGKIYVYRGGQEALTSYTNHQQLITQQVRYQDTGGVHKVHAVGDLAVVNREYNVSWREGRGLSAFTDMFGATFDGRSYEAYSLVPVFSETDLRNAPTDFPGWMMLRYLELPDTVPDRVLDLAYELTLNDLTNYDKAVSIEQYLRTFPYTLDLPAKPGGVDIADYFLFDLKEGYCDYYASAMVVLARAAGLPARLAIGYVGSKYDPEAEVYVVTADQAHAWVEIYFQEYGWVTFEPTAGRSAIPRETEISELPEFERSITFSDEGLPLSGLQVTLRVLLGLVLLGILLGLVWLRVEVILLRHMPIEKTFSRLYHRLLWFSKQLGVERGAAQTPLEFTRELQARLSALRGEYRLLKYLEGTDQKVDALVRLANKAAYSLELPDVFERAQGIHLWVSLRRELGFAVLWVRVMSLVPRRRKRQSPAPA